MKNLRNHITETLKESKIEGFEFLRLTDYENVLHSLEKFLTLGKQNLKDNWLWESFKEEFCIEGDSLEIIPYLIDSSQSYYFIASEENSKYWVAQGTGEAIQEVIKSMHYFEYYIVDKKFNWLICENHHNILIGTGTVIEKMKERMNKIRFRERSDPES